MLGRVLDSKLLELVESFLSILYDKIHSMLLNFLLDN
jgi:hypothetical protein